MSNDRAQTMVSERSEVGPMDRAELERIVRSRRAERRMVERAAVVLAAADGLDGLLDRPRSGRPLTHQPD